MAPAAPVKNALGRALLAVVARLERLEPGAARQENQGRGTRQQPAPNPAGFAKAAIRT